MTMMKNCYEKQVIIQYIDQLKAVFLVSSLLSLLWSQSEHLVSVDVR